MNFTTNHVNFFTVIKNHTSCPSTLFLYPIRVVKHLKINFCHSLSHHQKSDISHFSCSSIPLYATHTLYHHVKKWEKLLLKTIYDIAGCYNNKAILNVSCSYIHCFSSFPLLAHSLTLFPLTYKKHAKHLSFCHIHCGSSIQSHLLWLHELLTRRIGTYFKMWLFTILWLAV